MKIRKNLLKILTLLILSGSIINAGYIKEKNTIYFTDETTEPERKEIVKNVDFRTFKIFEENDDFARDKNNIYYRNKKLENFKPENFEVISSSLVGQNEDFYYFTEDENNNTKFILLENKNVDAETFEVLDEEYTKDKNNVYYRGKILKGADVKTFDIHYNKSDNGYKIKDKNKVYKIVND